jgi:hypothetical protein
MLSPHLKMMVFSSGSHVDLTSLTLASSAWKSFIECNVLDKSLKSCFHLAQVSQPTYCAFTFNIALNISTARVAVFHLGNNPCGSSLPP